MNLRINEYVDPFDLSITSYNSNERRVKVFPSTINAYFHRTTMYHKFL